MLENVKRNLTKAGLKVAKKKPEIMLGVGVICIGAGVVLTMKQCTKASEILKKKDEQLEKIAIVKNDQELVKDYSDEDEKRDLAKVYVDTGVELLKVYLPSLGLILGGVGLILGSHHQMNVRYEALLAAYQAAEKSRKILKKELVMDEKDIDDETKTPTKLDKEEFAYGRVFDSTNQNWHTDPDYNYLFIENQERYFNDLLKSRGHVFLNEVYEALGFEHTKEGSIIGWVYDTGENSGTQNFIAFDVYDEQWFMEEDSVFSSIMIDFNVDGVIYDLI